MNLRSLLVIPPVAVGVLGYLWMTSATSTVTEGTQEAILAVRAMTTKAEPVAIEGTGFGRVMAAQVWSALSEVQGRVVSMPDGIAIGSHVQSGQVLVEVDQTDLALTLRKAKANILAAEAQLAELKRAEKNTRRSLLLEEKILVVENKEYNRIKSLLKRGVSTRSALDVAEKARLTQESNVISLQNTLSLHPVQRASAEATLAVRQAELAEAMRAMGKATIVAPFRGRIAELNIQEGQFARTGDTLLTLEGIDAAEIIVEVQPSQFIPLLGGTLGRTLDFSQQIDMTVLLSKLNEAGITAVLRFNGDGDDMGDVYDSPVEIVRFRGAVDNKTGAMGIVVRIDDPLTIAFGGRRPPLVSGRFVTVVFKAVSATPEVLIPRDALRYSGDGKPFVYLADAQNRLTVQTVNEGPAIGNNIVIENGLSGGEILVLSTPQPPVIGLKLELLAAAER